VPIAEINNHEMYYAAVTIRGGAPRMFRIAVYVWVTTADGSSAYVPPRA
jgi:hypothetical protein